jgi:uroporphyrin-III C-methyltransferase / precorrin-2 dehydrogenase / sirohydrochlorin ferrochelatase
MDFLPIFMNMRGRVALVVGGGEVAARKAALLLEAGAKVNVVAPVLGSTLTQWRDQGRLRHRVGQFSPQDLDDCTVAIAGTDDRAVNQRVSALAQERRIPVNVVDQPDLCTFIMPSIVDRAPVMVAVSTGGASPVLARLLRARLETIIPAAYGRLASLVEKFRDRVKRRFKTTGQRRAFWEQVLQGPIAEMVFAGQDKAAEEALQAALADSAPAEPLRGEVYLVGAGPGDPDLLTFRALRLMQQADVVVYDRLVAPPILDLVRRDAERIYAGKERDNHALPQEDINHLLVRLAKEGKRVLRLKGGDPFIFGRGGEEISTLADERIPFQVVPGITAATGCAAYAGIPLTHRDYAQSCVFATGHLQDGTVNLDWSVLARPRQTVVFYMGLHGTEILCRELIHHGMPPTMPVAMVQQGTTPRQRVLIGTLETLADLVKAGDVKPPTLIIVGEVVKLHEKLAWFEPAAPEEGSALRRASARARGDHRGLSCSGRNLGVK